MIKSGDTRGTSGQTLIIVAIAMLVLALFVALAIDGGHLLAERRRMQNAADAGALAGAWEICFGTEDPWVKEQLLAATASGGLALWSWWRSRSRGGQAPAHDPMDD